MPGFRDRLADIIRGTRTEEGYYENYDEVVVPSDNHTLQSRQSLREKRMKRFGFPTHMNREDWILCVRVFGERFLPPPDEESRRIHSDILLLCDATVDRSLKTDGIVYLPVDRLQNDPLVNTLLHKNQGNTLAILCDLLLILVFEAIMWAYDDDYKLHLMDLWELTQDGTLEAADGTYSDYGPLQPVEVVLMRKVNVQVGKPTVDAPRVHNIKDDPKQRSSQNATENAKPKSSDGIDWSQYTN